MQAARAHEHNLRDYWGQKRRLCRKSATISNNICRLVLFDRQPRRQEGNGSMAAWWQRLSRLLSGRTSRSRGGAAAMFARCLVLSFLVLLPEAVGRIKSHYTIVGLTEHDGSWWRAWRVGVVVVGGWVGGWVGVSFKSWCVCVCVVCGVCVRALLLGPRRYRHLPGTRT